MCGLSGAGQVRCWGFFGDRAYAAPTLVSGTVTFRTIDVGYLNVCGVSTDRALYCWGINAGAFWGDNVTSRATPYLMAGGIAVDSVAVAGSFTCALSAPSALSCAGTLTGDAPTSPFTLMPVSRGAAPPFVSLTAGERQGCAIDTLGGAWCWGDNEGLGAGAGADIYAGLPMQLRIH
jgi:hypothetical protein